MNTNHQQKTQNPIPSPLKVVNPNPQIPPEIPQEITPEKTPKSPIKLPLKPILITLGLGGVMIGIAHIPASNAVRSDAKLEPAPDSHQIIYTATAGTLKEFLIKPGQHLQKNDPIAITSTEEMQTEISDAEAKFQQTLANLESTNNRINTYNSKLTEATIQEAAIQRQTQQIQTEINQLETGTPPPEIEKTNQEINALQNNSDSLQSQLNSRQEQLSIVEEQLSRYQDLMKDGAIALREVDTLKKEAANLRGETGSLQNKIQEIQSQKNAKQAEIETLTKAKQDQLKELQDQLSNRTAIRQTAQEELTAIKADVQNQIPLLKTFKDELQRRQNKQEKNQIIKASKSGFVMTQDFYKLTGKTLQQGEPVVEIADLRQLLAIIEVRQEDSDLIKAGATVTFHPVEPGIPSYTTRIDKIDLVMQPDATQQKQLLKVRAIIDNPEQKLLPGAKVYAQIESDPIPLYEKVQREFLKLFNFRKYGIGG